MEKHIDELKSSINSLFEKSTDAETLKSLGAINKALDEASAEMEKKDNDYKLLLDDYKDVVIHSSTPATGKPASDIKKPVSFEDALLDFTKGK